MTAALHAARARSAIRGGFESLIEIVQQVIPEDTAGREAMIGDLRKCWHVAAMVADSLADEDKP